MKILIVDDEALIAEKLERIVKECVHGMHTVRALTNAREALEVIGQEKPEVIVTDICMPKISGIDLARYADQQDYGARVIFLTGYAEFEYARSGIEYKVYDYLLKPVDEQEAVKCIRGALSSFLEEQKHAQAYQLFQNFFAENQEMVRLQFVEKLFFHPVVFSDRQMELQKQRLQIAVSGYRVVAAAYSAEELTLEEESYYSYLIGQFFKMNDKEVLMLESGGIFYMIWPVEKDELWKFCGQMEEVRKKLERSQPMHCIFAVSRYSESLSEVQQLKKEVLKCLDYGRKMGQESVISYKDLPAGYGENTFFDITESLAELIRQLRVGDKKKLTEQANKILAQAEEKTEEYFENTIEYIGANVFLFLSEVPLPKDCKDKISESFQQQVHAQSDRKMKTEYIKYWLEYIADNIQSMHNDDQNQLIQQIYKYLNENFSKPIGLDNVSEYVNRNPSYISRLIKQSTGKNFSKILVERRMEEAKKLLRSSSLKISQIAEQVGYPNLQYFTRVFTSQMSMTPAEYRKITTYF